MLKKLSIMLLASASMLRPTVVQSAELRETFLNECSEQIYQERVRDKKFVSAASLKIVGYIPKECLKRFDEAKRYLMIEKTNYLNSRLDDEKYRDQLAVAEKENVKKIIQSNTATKYNHTVEEQRSLTFATPGNDNKDEKPLIQTLKSYTTIQSNR